ncbi:MAG: uroporphyrinogen-III C-methyltransferase [Steroidobacteraceae bacterium]|jgi:uroporphyrin-3 C-methyltransferase|nr:uroporphyrinogen-III C-methyltransferase [Steroidobacteraceae bacterium]
MPETPEGTTGSAADPRVREPRTDASADRPADRALGDRQRLARVAWQSALALLAGIVAVVLVAMLAWRQIALERALERERGAGLVAARDLESLRAQLAALEQREAANAAALQRLASVPAQVESARADLDGLRLRLESPDRAIARVEAAQLVELAVRRLELDRDAPGAAALFEAADARLAMTGDPALFRARAQLARDLAQLRAVPTIDARALAARLARAGEDARRLPMLGAIRTEFGAADEPPGTEPGVARAWRRFTTSLQDLVSVRRVSEASIQLVSMEEQGVRRQHLETLLFAARLAAWRGDAPAYAQGLREARDWVDRHYDARDPGVQALARELASLATASVDAELPDVSASLRLLRAGAP